MASSSRRSFISLLAAIAGMAVSSQAQLVVGDDVLVRMAPEDAAVMAQRGMTAKTIDYGSFVMMSMNTNQLFQLDLMGIEYTAKQDPYRLTLGEISFDPARDSLTLPNGWNQIQQNVPELRVLQFEGPMREEWMQQIEDSGMKVVQYVHPYTYILWGTSDERRSAARMEGARWSSDFVPAFRVLPKFRNMAEETVSASITMINYADIEDLTSEIAKLGGKVAQPVKVDDVFSVVDVTLDTDTFQRIAQTPGIYSIQPKPTDGGLRGELSNQIVARNLPGGSAVPGYQNWLSSIALDGAGVIMANVDGGIFTANPDLTNQMLPCVGATCSGTAVDPEHGSHTAAIMAGDGSSGTVDGSGFLRGLGVAPGAKLVEQRYTPFLNQAGGMLQLIQESWDNNAVLSGNSWGPSGSPQGYDDATRQVDVGVRDADPNAPGNQQFTYVLSFMNGGGGFQTQGSPDEGKNMFTIGSTNAQTFSLAQDSDIFSLSANSAHGPALDGRTIPHMVAPGCNVDSVVSASGYGTLCGTSMASPHVAGAAALFIEQYRNNNQGATPTPALVKAAFLATAQSLEGNLDADNNILGAPFDSKQGWGLMDMQALFEADPNGIRYEDAPITFGATGETWTLNVSPLDPAKPVRIMLVWTDAPGHGLGGSTPAWNNNLDLKVTSGGNTYYGNNIAPGGFSAAGGSPDAINNTEGVFLAPGAGGVAIEVLAADINSDGVPGNDDLNDQDFSLACFNCAVEPGFVLVNSTAAQGICAPAILQYDIVVESILGYTAPVTLSAEDVPSGARVSFSSNPVVPGSTVTMQINYSGRVFSNTYDISVIGTNADTSRSTTITTTVSNGAPGIPLLATPTPGVSGTSLTPEFTWDEDSAATSYEIQIATDTNFNNIVQAATITQPTFTPDSALMPNTNYVWRLRSVNFCGNGSYSSPRSFTTRDTPPVLLVDDDNNSPDVLDRYTAALTDAGIDWDLWDTNGSAVEPNVNELAGYDIVLWFSGDAFGSNSAGPNGASETALASYLDDGGCLVLSSQDYLYDTLGFAGTTPNAFMQNYLGLAGPIDHDEAQITAQGMNTFAAFGPYTLSFNGVSNFSDVIAANGTTGEVAFQGNDGPLAVYSTDGNYHTLFTAFSLQSLPDTSDVAGVLSVMADRCVQIVQPCAGDTNNDREIDIEDLLTVLREFGTSGLNGNVDGIGNVDIEDLLMVLREFGVVCP